MTITGNMSLRELRLVKDVMTLGASGTLITAMTVRMRGVRPVTSAVRPSTHFLPVEDRPSCLR